MSSLSRTILADLAASSLPKGLARSEARGLLVLLKNGESADSLRKLIICGRADPASQQYRRQVLISFEIGLWQRNGASIHALSPVLRGTIVALARKGLSDRAIHRRIPVDLPLINTICKEVRAEQPRHERQEAKARREQEKNEAEILKCLRVVALAAIAQLRREFIQHLRESRSAEKSAQHALEPQILERLLQNQPAKQVASELHISISPVRKVSRKHGVSFRKTGRGRRYSATTVAAMTAELKAGARPTDVCEKFGCTPELTKRIRLQFGDRLDRRDLRRVKPEITEAVKQSLAAGQRPKEIKRVLGVSGYWLWNFRKNALNDCKDFRRDPEKIPADEAKLIAEALLADVSIRAVARQFHHGYSEIKTIGFAAGWAPRKCRRFIPDERARIMQLIAEGKSNEEIAKAMRCSTAAIKQARRKSQWTTQKAA
jgi:DNA-binding CsgD family transcriptional regulator